MYMKSHITDPGAAPQLPQPVQSLLETYLAELYRWNVRLNLTTVPPELAWERHVVEPLLNLESSLGRDWDGMVVADLGSGCGVPGIPCALAFAPSRMVLVEKDERKAAFLTHVSGLLELGTVDVVAQPAEEMGRDADYSSRFDLIVTRAAGRLDRVIRIGMPLLRPGGSIAALARPDAPMLELLAVAATGCGALLDHVDTGCVVVRKG